jgi:hypothetical protein
MLAIAITTLFSDKPSVNPCASIVAPWGHSLTHNMGQKTKYLRCTRKNYKLEELQIDSMYLEQVHSYRYLGSTVNSDNSIEEEMQFG